MVRAPTAQAGDCRFNLQQLPCFFFLSSSWLTNVDEIKDRWCSNTVQLLLAKTDINGVAKGSVMLS